MGVDIPQIGYQLGGGYQLPSPNPKGMFPKIGFLQANDNSPTSPSDLDMDIFYLLKLKMDKKMAEKEYPAHACQYCGSEMKWVETVIDDEFSRDEDEQEYVAVGFGDDFIHTGNDRCFECKRPRTGR